MTAEEYIKKHPQSNSFFSSERDYEVIIKIMEEFAEIKLQEHLRKKQPKSKVNKHEPLLKQCEVVFNNYPNLKRLPICAWGSFYKYELAGESFYSGLIDFNFTTLSSHLYYENEDFFDENLLDTIDESESKHDFEKSCYYEIYKFTPTEKTLIREFGEVERGGLLLYVEKNDNGILELKTIDCDSGE